MLISRSQNKLVTPSYPPSTKSTTVLRPPNNTTLSSRSLASHKPKDVIIRNNLGKTKKSLASIRPEYNVTPSDEHLPTEVEKMTEPVGLKPTKSQNEGNKTEVSLPHGPELEPKKQLRWREKKTDRAQDKHGTVTALIATDPSCIKA